MLTVYPPKVEVTVPNVGSSRSGVGWISKLDDVCEREPKKFLTVTVTPTNLPLSSVVVVYVELVAPDIFEDELRLERVERIHW